MIKVTIISDYDDPYDALYARAEEESVFYEYDDFNTAIHTCGKWYDEEDEEND